MLRILGSWPQGQKRNAMKFMKLLAEHTDEANVYPLSFKKVYFNDSSLYWYSVPTFWITYHKPEALRDILSRIINVL